MSGPAMEFTTLSLRTPPGGTKTGQTRIPQPPSLIPLLSPKTPLNQPPSSSLPSSLSVPQLSLVPPNRTPSGNGPPSQSDDPSQSPQVSASGGTSLPTLRSLRDLLPFGSAKPVANTATPGPLKGPFASFAPIRRSMNVERKNSSQFSRPGDDSDGAVISIAPSPPRQPSPERTRDTSRSSDAYGSSDPSPLSGSPLLGELGSPVVTFNPEPPLSSELSTILESDLSGLSRHLPALDASQITDLSGNRISLDPKASLPPSPGTDDEIVAAPDTSVLDLSISQLEEEVIHALKEKTSTKWMAGLPVRDKPLMHKMTT